MASFQIPSFHTARQPASLLPQGSFSESHTKPLWLKWWISGPTHVSSLGYRLSTSALPFSGLWLPRHTHSRLRFCSSSVSHCLPGFYWMSTGLLTLRGSKPEYRNQLPQQLSPQGFLLTWSSKLGTSGRGTAIRRQALRLLQRPSVTYTALFLGPRAGHSSLSSVEMSSVVWPPCL